MSMTAIHIPQLDTVLAAAQAGIRAATTSPATPTERDYWLGVAEGYTLAFDADADRQAITDAIIDGGAPFSYDEASYIEGGLAGYRAVGLLMGFKKGTAHLKDADECTACGNRVITTAATGWPPRTQMFPGDLLDCGNHGWSCGSGCRRNMNCTADQGPEDVEPEWDRDAYYASRYPEDGAA